MRLGKVFMYQYSSVDPLEYSVLANIDIIQHWHLVFGDGYSRPVAGSDLPGIPN